MSTTTPETPQPQQPPQGALSGALSSLVAVGQYASRACAAVSGDFTTLFRRDASPAQRARAAGGLALTAVIVAVLGYAAFQEWRIHIAYNPELTHQQLLKATADARAAKAEADAKNLDINDIRIPGSEEKSLYSLRPKHDEQKP